MITNLILSHYRNHTHLQITPEAPYILISGPNGSGKTNVLEALSFLSPGRGLRGAKLQDIIPNGSTEHWTVHAQLAIHGETRSIGTALESSEGAGKRVVKIDQIFQKSQLALAEHLRMLWLTPQMEPALLSGTTARRHYIDRITFYFDPEHAKRVAHYEKTLRERSKLLSLPPYDADWCRVLEERLASLSLRITQTRKEALERVMQHIDALSPSFPRALLRMVGGVETLLASHSKEEAEALLTKQLSESRQKDYYTGQTSHGAHRSDLEVYHAQPEQSFALCSTGEQKALLLSLLLAQARASLQHYSTPPILLLDEVAVHLDDARRNALFQELLALQVQCWVTTTDPDLFHTVEQHCHHIVLDHTNKALLTI